MFRLGIIGSDNSHAEAFASLANLSDGNKGMKIDDVQVTHIYGTDEQRTKEVATKCQIPNIVTRSEDMLGNVDGVACVWRHGSKHLNDTLPFLKAGLPAFVDKPLASSVADARELIETAQKAKVGFTSFSTLRYCVPTVEWLKNLPAAIDAPVSCISTGPAEIDSEYDGIFFYGIHAVDLMLAAWGYGVTSVSASEQNKQVVAVCKYASGRIATLNLLYHATYVFHLSAFGAKGYSDHVVDSSTSYYEGMKVFLDTLRTGNWPLTPEQLLEPIQILAAVDKSLKEKREVQISEV